MAAGQEVSADEANGTTVRITLRDVYDAVQGLKTDLAAGLGKMDAHTQLPNHAGSERELVDHESRLRKLEKVAWMALGISAVVSPALAVILYFAGKS